MKPGLVTTLSSGLPARPIDATSPVIEDTRRDEISFARLVDVEIETESPPPLALGLYCRYLTLSHCWGSGLLEDDKTVASSLEERKRQIKVASLCKNF